MACGIGYLESIPGLPKRLQIWAQATLASGIGSLESIPWLHNMKNEDEDDLFLIEMNIFVPHERCAGTKRNRSEPLVNVIRPK